MRPAVFTVALALSCANLAAGRLARADGTRVIVEPGHTLESLAHHYHVTSHAIAAANHLKEGAALTPGQLLVIPDPPGEGTKIPPGGSPSRTAARGGTGRGAHLHFERDVVHAIRFDEEFTIRVKDGRGKLPANALLSFERLMRQNEATHPPDPRLVARIGIVSNHFEGRTLEVVSGFRAFTPTQYTAHSRHNLGRALDFRVQGIPNEELRDFCRTLPDTGCGYYPNSTFVHLDVRDAKAYWVDLSHPGEPPHYEKLGANADEGTSDVTTESH